VDSGNEREAGPRSSFIVDEGIAMLQPWVYLFHTHMNAVTIEQAAHKCGLGGRVAIRPDKIGPALYTQVPLLGTPFWDELDSLAKQPLQADASPDIGRTLHK
jgi:hypothetical protein